MGLSDSDDDELQDVAPVYQRPEPPAGTTVGGAAAGSGGPGGGDEEEDDARGPPVAPRALTLSPPPVGWKFSDQDLILLADGATAGDKALQRVLIDPDANPDEDEDDTFAKPNGKAYYVPRSAIKYWNGASPLTDLFDALLANKCRISLDAEWLKESSRRIRPGTQLFTRECQHE